MHKSDQMHNLSYISTVYNVNGDEKNWDSWFVTVD